MDTAGSSLTRGSGRPPSGPSVPRRALDLVFDALEGHANSALAQALMAMARDPQSAAFDRVHVFDWDERREELCGWAASGEGEAGEGTSPARGVSAPPPLVFRPERLTGVVGEAWRSGRAALGPAGNDEDLPWHGAALVGALALEAGEHRFGLLVGEWSDSADAAKRQEAIERFAREAAALMRAVERASLERRRSRHARSLAEFTRASVSALNLAEALHLAARLAAEGSGSRGSAVWRVIPDALPRLEVTFGIAGERERVARGLQPLAAQCVAHGSALLRDRTADGALISPEVAANIASVAFLPVRAYGRDLAVIAVYDRAPRGALEPAGYDEVEMAALATLADLLALVLDQAGRFEELKRQELRGRELQARVTREERLATLGEMASRVAAEARNPLASIGAFARRVHRELPESTPHREYLEIVIRETERLERLVGTPLESLPAEPMRLRIENLNEVVQDALRLAGETLVRRRVRLLKKLAPDLPPLLLDAEHFRLAVSNVVRQALEAVPIGGRIRVESRRSGGFAMVEIAHDGPREPGDILEQLFVPFSSSPGGGASTLGLAMAHQIIQAHGGEIRARGEAEWTAVVTLTLPILGNEDRRLPRGERRQSRPDRRRRGPES